jgi:hypothetical protein
MSLGPPGEFGTLVVKTENRQPLPLSVVSELLAALAQDYRRITGGRELTIESVHQGSLIAVLRDLADWADQANHLFDFVTHIGTLVTGAIAGIVLLHGHGRKDGSRTVIAIAQAAIEGKASVTMAHKGRHGDILMVEVNPTDADVISRQRPVPPKSDRARPKPEASAAAAAAELATIASAAIEAASADEAAGMMVLLRALIRIVRQRPDGQRRLDEVAQGLRSHGYDAAAAIMETQ